MVPNVSVGTGSICWLLITYEIVIIIKYMGSMHQLLPMRDILNKWSCNVNSSNVNCNDNGTKYSDLSEYLDQELVKEQPKILSKAL